jgi:hypothetical protein
MTLLIGTASDTHVFLTSDRRCTVEEQGIVTTDDSFQKIFPVLNRPLAIVHHGENVLLDDNGTRIPLSTFITRVVRENADVFEEPCGGSIIRRLAERTDAMVRRTLDSRGKELVGFWVAGFARGRMKPEICEVCWFKNGRTEFHEHGNLVVGGDGQEHLPPNVRDSLDGTYNLKSIPRMPSERVRRYHNKLFNIALQKEPEPRRFSDVSHQLVITREKGCEWIVPLVQA